MTGIFDVYNRAYMWRLERSSTQHRLDVDPAHPFQRAREEGVHRHRFARLLQPG